MIDIQPALYNTFAKQLRAKRPEMYVTGELSDRVARFPCVQMEETGNIPTQIDNAAQSRYAYLTYRVRVYSNKKAGKATEARQILADVDKILESLNLRRKTFTAMGGLYTNSAYRIDCTYTVCADANGVLYLR